MGSGFLLRDMANCSSRSVESHQHCKLPSSKNIKWYTLLNQWALYMLYIYWWSALLGRRYWRFSLNFFKAKVLLMFWLCYFDKVLFWPCVVFAVCCWQCVALIVYCYYCVYCVNFVGSFDCVDCIYCSKKFCNVFSRRTLFKKKRKLHVPSCV